MSCSRVFSESSEKKIEKEIVSESEIEIDDVISKVNIIGNQITIGTLETNLKIDGRVQLSQKGNR